MSAVAQQAKELGNATFKSGDFALAVGHYTSAILADPQNPTYPLNRAAAYLKLGKYNDAERDCTTVLNLDSTNVKGWFRRGQARDELRKAADALNDFKQVLLLDPANTAAQKEIERLQALSKASPPRSITKSSSSQKTTVSSTKRRRIPIQIVEASPQESSSASHSTSQLLTPLASRSFSRSDNTTNAFSSQSQPVSNPNPPKVSGGIFRQNGQHTMFKSSAAISTTTVSQPGKGVSAPGRTQVQTLQKDTPAPMSPLFPPTSETQISLFTFTKSWDSLGTSQERWELLMTVPPHAVPSLFKTSLEPALLTSIVHVFLNKLRSPNVTSGDKLLIRSYVGTLPRIPRFKTIVLFFSSQEQKEIFEVLGAIPNNSDLYESWGVKDLRISK